MCPPTISALPTPAPKSSLRKILEQQLVEHQGLQITPKLLNILLSQNLLQTSGLQGATADSERQGELALKDAKVELSEWQHALRSARDKPACLLWYYQELMNDKLFLDTEIATNGYLLAGEKSKRVPPQHVSISHHAFCVWTNLVSCSCDASAKVNWAGDQWQS
uniref:IF rod domain-containing protein n=1 Tax=Varanus komodoensis TaxID=61221 RepID=A0A8D2LLA2_VARKO